MTEWEWLELERIADGTHSPLKGFMNQKDYLCVAREARLENGLPWAHPVTLSLAEAEGDVVRRSPAVSLEAPNGKVVGILEVTDVFRPDGESAVRPLCVGGEVIAFEKRNPRHHSTAMHRRSPLETRALFKERGWSRVVGFAEPSPILRAHEFVAKSALELVDGLLFGIAVGTSGSARDEADVHCVEAILKSYFPAGRALLAIHPGLGRGGPREAIAQAIAHKNHGCSHLAIRSAIEGFGDYSAADLGITVLRFEEPFYSTKSQSMATAKTAPGDPATRLAMTVDAVIASIERGAGVAPEIARPEVLAILSALDRG